MKVKKTYLYLLLVSILAISIYLYNFYYKPIKHLNYDIKDVKTVYVFDYNGRLMPEYIIKNDDLKVIKNEMVNNFKYKKRVDSIREQSGASMQISFDDKLIILLKSNRNKNNNIIFVYLARNGNKPVLFKINSEVISRYFNNIN